MDDAALPGRTHGNDWPCLAAAGAPVRGTGNSAAAMDLGYRRWNHICALRTRYTFAVDLLRQSTRWFVAAAALDRRSHQAAADRALAFGRSSRRGCWYWSLCRATLADARSSGGGQPIARHGPIVGTGR